MTRGTWGCGLLLVFYVGRVEPGKMEATEVETTHDNRPLWLSRVFSEHSYYNTSAVFENVWIGVFVN